MLTMGAGIGKPYGSEGFSPNFLTVYVINVTNILCLEGGITEMKKTSLLTTIVLLMTLASVASAGETKGPPGEGGAKGGPTPIGDFWTGDGAASICSFSGLNDVIDATEPTQTQSYGTFLSLIMHSMGIRAPEAKAVLGEAPGHACNPAKGPFGNPKKM